MEESSIDCRRFLTMAGFSAAFGGSMAHATRYQAPAESVSQRTGLNWVQRFVSVNVSPDRVIRTVVGLRHYRPSGFVLKSEQLYNKTIIHNYGHGGAGVTLSWGTASLSIEEALKTDATTFAVLGCGVIGAGALWFPVSVYDQNKVLTAL